MQARLWLTLHTPATNSLNPSPTDTDSYTHPIYMHYINALPSFVQFSNLLLSFLSLFIYIFFKVLYSCLIFV